MVWISPFPHVKSNEEMYKNTKIWVRSQVPARISSREVAWSDGIMGFAQTEHPEETKEFIEWFLEEQ